MSPASENNQAEYAQYNEAMKARADTDGAEDDEEKGNEAAKER